MTGPSRRDHRQQNHRQYRRTNEGRFQSGEGESWRLRGRRGSAGEEGPRAGQRGADTDHVTGDVMYTRTAPLHLEVVRVGDIAVALREFQFGDHFG